MSINYNAFAIIFASLLAFGGPALAADPPADKAAPSVFHSPASTWKAGEPQRVSAVVEADWNLQRLFVELRIIAGTDESAIFAEMERACRTVADSRWIGPTRACQVPFRRANDQKFIAKLPGELVQPPGLTYFIAGVATEGEAPIPYFASAKAPHTVLVSGETDATRTAQRLDRHHGNRNRIELRGDATLFGPARVLTPEGAFRSDNFSDRYGGGDVIYTHRLLGMLYAFRLGIGVMRGTRPTYVGADGQRRGTGQGDSPGLNYGWAELDFEFFRSFSMAIRVNLGASEDGFAGGVGALFRVGPHFSTHLEVGIDWVNTVGPKGWATFHWDTVPYVPMALSVELTTYPSDAFNAMGTRLYYDLGFDITEDYSLTVRVGYAKRSDSYLGGLIVGLATAYEF